LIVLPVLHTLLKMQSKQLFLGQSLLVTPRRATDRQSAAISCKTKAASKTAVVKTKVPASQAPRGAPRILSRVQQLRLLSKLEEAGLLSKLEKSGITLTFIEQSGLLSKAEQFGLLSAAADRNTPSALYAAALALAAAGGALVYFVPDDTTTLIVAQAVGAGVLIGGAVGAFVGASFLSNLQK
jgi:hypothetical protein